MAQIFDFDEHKKQKETANILEENYNTFLIHINKILPIPKSFNEACSIFYYVLRYLDGTVNALTILSLVGIDIPQKEKEQFKEKIIDWLQDIIKNIKTL